MTRWGRQAATLLLRTSPVSRAVRALASARGHRLVLVYHRVGPARSSPCAIIPSVPIELFRAHLQTLADVADLVTLDEILVASQQRPRLRSETGRPAVAITFDDDLPSHASDALPVLRESGVAATFFLSGRALHGLGPYWFQQLEAVLLAHGEVRTAALLGLKTVSPADGWVRHCDGDADVRRRISGLAADLPAARVLSREDLSALGAAGMTIGFHTVDHHIIPGLDDVGLIGAVTHGRHELARAAGMEMRYFAYPYGRADRRSAAAVADAGFDAAFTGRPEPVRPGSNRYHLGRWEPGPLGVDDLLVKLAVRLHRAAPSAAQRSR